MALNIQERVPLSTYTTLHVGGEAEYFLEAHSAEALRDGVLFAKDKKIPWRIIGEGSNILVDDEMIPGITIKNALKGIQVEHEEGAVVLTVGAGETLDAIVRFSCEHGWWGLENLSSIPGTVGATPVQNVGAYGVEVAGLIRSVSAYDASVDEIKNLSVEGCRFSYRHSFFKESGGKHLIILSVTFVLSTLPRPHVEYRDLALHFADTDSALCTPSDIRRAVAEIRSRKFPNWHEVGTAGSFFKNPTVSEDVFVELQKLYPELSGHRTEGGVKLSLGWILDHICGLRGFTEGHVRTYEMQALVLVAEQGATAQEIDIFAQKISARVKEKIGIDIEREVTQITARV